jgi:hypothetical protein
LSLQSQRQSLEKISRWCRSSLALRMDGLRSMFSVLERIKEEYYNARKVEGCELEARVDLWLEMGHTLKKIHAGITSIVDEQPNKFSLATRRRISAVDDKTRRLARLLHKRQAVGGPTCSVYSLCTVVEAMDLKSRLELQSDGPTIESDGPTIESDGETASSYSHSGMPAATTDSRSKKLAKLWRERHRINQAFMPVLCVIRSRKLTQDERERAEIVTEALVDSAMREQDIQRSPLYCLSKRISLDTEKENESKAGNIE